MNGKICLVTGGTRGIGQAIATGLARRGASVIIVGRDLARATTAQAEIKAQSGADVGLMLADLSSQQAVRGLVNEIRSRYGRLDVLINNAGLVKKARTLTVDGLEMTFAVNHLAPFLLTHLALDILCAHARIIMVSSLVHKWGTINFDDLQGEHNYDMDKAYNQSKLANIYFTYELARRLKKNPQTESITANSMEPGMTMTDFGHEYTGFKKLMVKLYQPFMRSPAQAAETAIYLATAPEMAEVSGKHFIKNREVRSAAATYDQAIAQRLWEVSAKLVGIV